MFPTVLTLQLAPWEEFCFISFVSLFSGNPKEGRAECPVRSHSSLSYLTSILLKLAQTFPSLSQESHFCFNFSVYPESVSGLSTARETPSKLAVSTSLMNSRVTQMLKPQSPFKHAVPKPHIYQGHGSCTNILEIFASFLFQPCNIRSGNPEPSPSSVNEEEKA